MLEQPHAEGHRLVEELSLCPERCRKGVKGGPQPSELNKMIEMAKKDLANNEAWVASTENQLSQSEKKLNNDFDQMLK